MSAAPVLSFPRGTVLGIDGTPRASASAGGHHVRRTGANLQGTLVNWAAQLVSARVAEREKRQVDKKASSLYTNSAIAHGIIEGIVIETVGSGLTPMFTPDSEALDQDEAWADAYTNAAERFFERWAFDPRKWCDAQRRTSFYGLQALAYCHWKLHGIGLFQVRMVKDPMRPARLALLPIDPSRLQTPTSARRNQQIFDGVEIDPATGQPLRVHLTEPAPPHAAGGRMDTKPFDVWHKATGLPQILMVCDVRNVAEYRQDSVLTSILGEIKNNDDFVEAALVQAIQQTLISMYVSLKDPSGGLFNSGTGAVGSTEGQDIDWSQRVHQIAMGTILEGPAGYEPTFMEPKAPNAQYDTLWRSIVGRAGAATQRGAESILREYSDSYSAALASVENAERCSEYDREIVLNPTWNQPVCGWLQYEAVLRGALPEVTAEDFLRNIYAYSRCEFLPPPPRVIRPDVQEKANTAALQSGTDTLPDIYARRGKKWREQRRKTARQLQYDRQLEEEFGVEMPPVGKAAAPAAPSREDEETDEET